MVSSLGISYITKNMKILAYASGLAAVASFRFSFGTKPKESTCDRFQKFEEELKDILALPLSDIRSERTCFQNKKNEEECRCSIPVQWLQPFLNEDGSEPETNYKPYPKYIPGNFPEITTNPSFSCTEELKFCAHFFGFTMFDNDHMSFLRNQVLNKIATDNDFYKCMMRDMDSKSSQRYKYQHLYYNYLKRVQAKEVRFAKSFDFYKKFILPESDYEKCGYVTPLGKK